MTNPTDAGRLAAVNEAILAEVENGPWRLIPDPDLRRLVGGWVAETCRTIAAAAGLDEAIAAASRATPAGLAMALPGLRLADDARDRLARSLFIGAVGELWADGRAAAWDRGTVGSDAAAPFLAQADVILAVIAVEG